MARKPNLIERVGMRLADGFLREAAGDTAEPDEHLYRRLTDSRRDLTPIEQDRARRISLHLWRSNPMARRIIEMIVDFTVGADGLSITAGSDSVQQVIDDVWNDPVMDLRRNNRSWVRDLSLAGELALSKNVAGVGGRVRYGFLDPDRIRDVLPERGNVMVDETLVMMGDNPGDPERRIPLVRWIDGEAAVAAGTDAMGSWQGDALYFGIHRPTGAHRGTPDLLALADWIDGYDQLLFNALEKTGLANAFIYDVTLTGADDDAIADWQQKHGVAPPPGSLRVHNEKEAWQAVAPSLNNIDTVALGRPIKNMALGGAGLPEAWFAEGDSASRATLSAQGDPTYRMLQSRQQEIEKIFERLIRVAIQEATGSKVATDEGTDFQIVLPPISEKDASSIAAAIPQVANGLAAAVEAEFIDKASGRRVFLAVASQLGVELDPAEVEAAVEAEAAEREAAKAEEDATRLAMLQQAGMVDIGGGKAAPVQQPPPAGPKPAGKPPRKGPVPA